ncbi:MAG: disulfide bond formation protein B [Arenicella sp.]|nr:disulfide bond formation protein B [Arenicella sp.]
MIATRWYWIGFVGCAVLLGIAYFYFQQTLGLAPCPLCMFQRVALVGVGFLCLVGILVRPAKLGSRLLALMATLFSAAGLAIAARQVWLQNLPEELVPECGPDLGFMLDSWPLLDVIKQVMAGSGECAEVQWQFLGLSMPAWMIVVFTVMTLISLKLVFIRERRYFNKPYADD